MQKIVYLSNSRDYTAQDDVNENRYFTRVNKLLEEGWRVSHFTHDILGTDSSQNPARNESLVSLILLEKEDEK